MGMHLLAQIGGTVDVPDLPRGPAFDRMVFEQPSSTATGLLILGIFIAIVLGRNGRERAAWAVGIGAALLGIVIVIIGSRVETTRERLMRAAHEFVDAAAAGRASDVGAILEERIALRSGGDTVDEDRDWVMGVVAGLPGVVKEHSVRMRGVELEGENRGRTRMTVRVRAGAAYGGDMYSTWDLVWIRRLEGGADGWWIGAIECLSIFGREPDGDWVRQGAEIARTGKGSSGQ